MLNEEEKIKIDQFSIKELGEKIALHHYGAMDSDKSRYAQYIFETKNQEEINSINKALVGVIDIAGEGLAASMNRLTESLDKQVEKISILNKELSRSQEKYSRLQGLAAIALVIATIVLASITWIKQ